MRKISQKQLTDHVNLVKWEEKKTLSKFNLLTVHSLLLNTNPKFVELKQKVQNFNSSIAKGVERKHLQFEYTKKLYEMLRQMVQIPTYEGQNEFLNTVYEWSKQGTMNDVDFDQFSQLSKSRPTTATTRTRPFSAYSRPKSGVTNKAILMKFEEKLQIREQNKTKKGIDYQKLRPGQIQFYTGARTIHQNEQKPKKRLKEYQRKIFYEQEQDSDIEIIDLQQKDSTFNFRPMSNILQTPVEEPPQEQNLEGENRPEGEQNILGEQDQGQDGEDDINIDDLPIEGEGQQGEVEEVVDKLKPRFKAFVKHQTDLSKNHHAIAQGIHKYAEQRNKMIRKNQEDQIIKEKMLEWAKQKSRTKREQKRRAQSARIVTKQVGIGYKKNQPQEQNMNVINLQSINVPQTKQSRPKTAFRAFNQANRKQLIQNCFMTGAMSSHIQKFQKTGTLEARSMRVTSLAQKPKKKTFQQILREAEEKVKEEEMNEILNVKEKFARSKVPFETNRIAKSVTYHSMAADNDDEYEYEDGFVGNITGLNMVKNPFFKFGKKKKKKKKKK